MFDDFPVLETEEVKILHADLLSRRRDAEQLAAMRAGRGIPHGHMIAFRDHCLDSGFDVREGHSDCLDEIGEAIGSASLVCHRFMAPVDEVGRKDLGRHVQLSLVEHLLDDSVHKLLVVLKSRSTRHSCLLEVCYSNARIGTGPHCKEQGALLQVGTKSI